VRHRVELEIYTAEAQQLVENDRQLFLIGARWQGGEFDTVSRFANPLGFTNELAQLPARTRVDEDFQRSTIYAYETLKLPGRLRLTGGLAYERLKFPKNFRAPPIQAGEEKRERWNPKAALVWEALPQATLRGAYANSLGGVSLDESFGLEPRQLGGFSQAFRTLIPESLAGSVAAPEYEVGSAALDLKFPSRTYVRSVCRANGWRRRSTARSALTISGCAWAARTCSSPRASASNSNTANAPPASP
jgi:hypothetical protein